ncbi:MAG: hypothetical protein F9K27_13770 [Anaerolineae bacterium]|nr:MAG: hypothetical protein F9K27_13770 [Anaerolineae bacterium]
MKKFPAFLLFLILLLAGCIDGGGTAAPLIVVATRAPLDAGFQTYLHPSGVFSIRVPPQWIPDQLPFEDGVRVQFTSIENSERVVRLTVMVINTGEPLTAEAFARAVQAYQPQEDGVWTATAPPAAMTDGSVRLQGLRLYPTIGTRGFNIFLQGNGSYFSSVETDVTGADSAMLQTLMASVNTFRVNTNVPLGIGSVNPMSVTSASGVLGFDHYTHWEDTNGGFNITGEVKNLAEVPLEAVRLTAFLLDAEDNILVERSTILAYDVLAPGESAPFRIRFDSGRPSIAVRYEIQGAARAAEFSLSTFYGNDNFLIGEDRAFYNTNGFLTVTGLIQNNNTKLAKSIRVLVAIVTDEGQVVAVQDTFINKDQLLPGEATSFEVTFDELGGNAFKYKILVQGTTD